MSAQPETPQNPVAIPPRLVVMKRGFEAPTGFEGPLEGPGNRSGQRCLAASPRQREIYELSRNGDRAFFASLARLLVFPEPYPLAPDVISAAIYTGGTPLR